jgi:hypothetical protein
MVLMPDGSWKLSAKAKLCFAVGGAPAQVTSTVFAFFLSPFMLEVVGLRAALVGVILLVGRFIDAISDPLIGYLSDRTESSLGRRRPWLFLSLIPTCAHGPCNAWRAHRGRWGGAGGSFHAAHSLHEWATRPYARLRLGLSGTRAPVGF